MSHFKQECYKADNIIKTVFAVSWIDSIRKCVIKDSAVSIHYNKYMISNNNDKNINLINNLSYQMWKQKNYVQ